ncbi:hypothetical protein HZH66_003883 [Vespula vulgaris]|uniref:Uncharacterized protein n=1 Tax=Vespula vulgaris TaxID=7454 RepID=A0A834KE49_VESVU|nr:hypothetical protein HZH66_003883 [Vespula vulgaris]
MKERKKERKRRTRVVLCTRDGGDDGIGDGSSGGGIVTSLGNGLLLDLPLARTSWMTLLENAKRKKYRLNSSSSSSNSSSSGSSSGSSSSNNSISSSIVRKGPKQCEIPRDGTEERR